MTDGELWEIYFRISMGLDSADSSGFTAEILEKKNPFNKLSSEILCIKGIGEKRIGEKLDYNDY